MAARRSKASADDGLNELFEGIDESVVKKPASKSKPAPSKTRGEKLKKDIPGLAELEDELGEEPARPHTPRVKETSTKAPVKRTSTATPPPGAPRQSEDKPANVARKSVDSTRSLHASFTPSATSSDLQDAEKKGSAEETAPAADGGWWGGLFATASATANAAMKQAEAAYKEIQQNEEAKKWADQVKGNVGALRGLGMYLNTAPTY